MIYFLFFGIGEEDMVGILHLTPIDKKVISLSTRHGVKHKSLLLLIYRIFYCINDDSIDTGSDFTMIDLNKKQ